jgi:hypothetical protein
MRAAATARFGATRVEGSIQSVRADELRLSDICLIAVHVDWHSLVSQLEERT